MSRKKPKHYKQIIGNAKTLQCVALGGRIPININGGAIDGNRTCVEAQKLYNVAGRGGNIGGICPMMVNWRLDSTGIFEGANSIRIAASILTPLIGTARKYTFKSELNPIISKGATIIADYGFDMDIAANTQFLMRFSAQVSTAGYTIIGGNLSASLTYDLSKSHTDSIIPIDETANCGGRVHNNVAIGSYAPTNAANALFPYTAACILGYSERPQVAVLVIGDSNAYGTGDATFGDGQGAVGYIERGLRSTASGVTAGSNWSRSGGTLGIYTAGNAPQLFESMKYHTHLLQQLSGNSIGAGTSLAMMKQLTVIAWEAAKTRNLRTIQLSSLPRTTNASNIAVAVGWEVGGLRDQYNLWAQSVVGQKINANGDLSANGVIYLDAYWNCNDLLQNPATNLWLSATYTSDGIHLSAIGHALAATRIAALADGLTIY